LRFRVEASRCQEYVLWLHLYVSSFAARRRATDD
jgi:hypothetical protein